MARQPVEATRRAQAARPPRRERAAAVRAAVRAAVTAAVAAAAAAAAAVAAAAPERARVLDGPLATAPVAVLRPVRVALATARAMPSAWAPAKAPALAATPTWRTLRSRAHRTPWLLASAFAVVTAPPHCQAEAPRAGPAPLQPHCSHRTSSARRARRLTQARMALLPVIGGWSCLETSAQQRPRRRAEDQLP